MLRFCRRNYSIGHLDFEPHSVIKVLSSSKTNVKVQEKPEVKVTNASKNEKPVENETRTNVNEMGIQMISKSLFQQIFRNPNASQADQELIEK